MRNFPKRIVLELTPICNLSCPMCPRHYIKDTDGFMDVNLFKKLVDEIVIESPDAIILPFWRGESCMHPNFVELIDYTLQRNLRVHLSTNGHYMNRDNIELFYRCEFVTFSLHDNRGYKNAIKFISNKPENSYCTTQVSFVNSEKTTQKFLKKCTSSQDLKGFDSIRLYHDHTIDGEFGNSNIDSSQNRTFCPKLEHTFVVSADGQYSRCNHIWEPETHGNLYKSTIKEIWKNKRMNEIREQYPDNKCISCDQWNGHTNGEVWIKSKDNKVTRTIYTITK